MNTPTRKFKWILPFIFIFPAIILLIGWVVMMLWNTILPQVLHVGPISYIQALGIFLLCKILIGGFRFFPRPWRRFSHAAPWREKWVSMSDEEKEKFREEWKRRCRE
jgi:hypothetical protein